MSVLVTVGEIMAAFAVMVAPFPLAGYLIQRGRSRRNATIKAGPEYIPEVHDSGALAALEPDTRLDDLTWGRLMDTYVVRMTPVYRQHLRVIDDALGTFVRRHGITLGAISPCGSVDTALLRLRHGIHEPALTTRAYQVATSEWDAAGLREILAAEDAVPA